MYSGSIHRKKKHNYVCLFAGISVTILGMLLAKKKKKKSKYLCRSRCMDWNCEFHRNKELCCEETRRVKKN